MYQTGGLGLIFFLFWWFMIIVKIYKKGNRFSNNNLYQLSSVFIFINIGYMFTGLLSEQIFTFSSVAHFWFFNGVFLSVRDIQA